MQFSGGAEFEPLTSEFVRPHAARRAYELCSPPSRVVQTNSPSSVAEVGPARPSHPGGRYSRAERDLSPLSYSCHCRQTGFRCARRRSRTMATLNLQALDELLDIGTQARRAGCVPLHLGAGRRQHVVELGAVVPHHDRRRNLLDLHLLRERLHLLLHPGRRRIKGARTGEHPSASTWMNTTTKNCRIPVSARPARIEPLGTMPCGRTDRLSARNTV